MGYVGCEKLQRYFMAWTFAFITPVQYVLQQVSCSYETIRIAPKYYKTHRNIGIGSNGVDWLCWLRKIPTWLRVTNFCINCTSSVCFASSFIQLRNDPKCTEILWKWIETLVWGPTWWIGRVRCEKLQRDFMRRTFVLTAPVQYVLNQVSFSYETIQMHQNTIKQTETLL